MRLSVLFAFVRVLSVPGLIRVPNRIPRVPACVCPYQQYTSSLASSCTWRHRAAASASPSGYPLIMIRLPRFPYRKQQKEAQIHTLHSKQWPLRVHTLPAVLTGSPRQHRQTASFSFSALSKQKPKTSSYVDKETIQKLMSPANSNVFLVSQFDNVFK